ncbi:bifunctional 23S rRNA (guanine(2069)-N(7))-methyltransferase RlmK/23S rRNA (guanine(2445)-N(2))-methyltransferase RlmL [bacterium]|nr:bifunctional 23S rRNA (guanine(2069)-N(7))-methyltransferase RlmK/23S rRNA (guanine(2445)-N(2))-methyltransferase RlmL [bacterium]
MNDSPALNLIATTAFGIEAVTAKELEHLGYQPRIDGSGRVRFTGDWTDAMRANLHLRTADRVLIEVAQIPAGDFDALFEGVQLIDWEKWIDAKGAFPVKARSYQSQLTSLPAIQRATKRAIVERLQSAYGPSLPETGAGYTIEIAIAKDIATLTIDTSGQGLARRGYLDAERHSPMKPTLAAALVQLSFWNQDRPLLDPFCGSGIILIEAAMIARKIAPGLLRDFALIDWPAVDQNVWLDLQEEARAEMLPSLPETIIGYDEDASALHLARQQAIAAGVDRDIHFQKQSFVQLTSKRQYGCLITSLPYDDHPRARRAQWDFYRGIPDVLRHLPTWSHFILTAYPEFERAMGQEADRRRKMYLGRTECHFYQYHGPPPGKPERQRDVTEEETPEKSKPQIVPAFGGLDDKAHEQAQLLKNRLAKRARHLRRWPKRGIHCYRLYDRDIPEIPLVIDLYHDCLHVTDYDRPHDRTPAQYSEWLEHLCQAASEVLEIPAENVFLKHRQRQTGSSQHEKVSDESRILIVEEGGLKFEVNLTDYVDTGLFLDHRNLRNQFRDEAAGKHVLNLFCYTGAFSVYAAAGGAALTTSVDLNANYLDWAGRNFQLNGLSIAKHHFIRSDVMEYLRDQKPGPKFDLAIVDVPTFSNSKRNEEIWDVQHDHVELLQRTLGLMSPGGVVYFSNNFRRFKLDEAALSDVAIREISKHTVPEDFRNQRIHRCWKLVKYG